MRKHWIVSIGLLAGVLGVGQLAQAQDDPVKPEDGIVIRCNTNLECVVTGYSGSDAVEPPHSKPQDVVVKPQAWTIGTASGKDIPPGDGSPEADVHGKHCWVQLPNGTWQMYHCGP